MTFSNTRYRENSFSRSTANEAKMGAYYTDVAHCTSLSGLFLFPEGKEVSVLEPSIGDGSAVIAATDREHNEDIHIFGVELNESVAKQTAENPMIEECLNADFTDGVKISNRAFSFCFGNPPYMDDEDDVDGARGRMERTFLSRVTESYLKKGGILVWVIPYRIFADPGSIRYFLRHYETLGVWRFRNEEYAKWKQVAYVGRKKSPSYPSAEEVKAEVAKYDAPEKIPVLPFSFEGTEYWHSIEAPESKSEELTLFTTMLFDADRAVELLQSHPPLETWRKIVGKKLTQEAFAATSLGRPPIPLKKDSLYLLATSGAGQGVAGTPGEDLHLQRGVAEVVEDVEFVQSEDGTNQMKVTSRTQVTMTVIETNGKITTLQ